MANRQLSKGVYKSYDNSTNITSNSRTGGKWEGMGETGDKPKQPWMEFLAPLFGILLLRLVHLRILLQRLLHLEFGNQLFVFAALFVSQYAPGTTEIGGKARGGMPKPAHVAVTRHAC